MCGHLREQVPDPVRASDGQARGAVGENGGYYIIVMEQGTKKKRSNYHLNPPLKIGHLAKYLDRDFNPPGATHHSDRVLLFSQENNYNGKWPTIWTAVSALGAYYSGPGNRRALVQYLVGVTSPVCVPESWATCTPPAKPSEGPGQSITGLKKNRIYVW